MVFQNVHPACVGHRREMNTAVVDLHVSSGDSSRPVMGNNSSLSKSRSDGNLSNQLSSKEQLASPQSFLDDSSTGVEACNQSGDRSKEDDPLEASCREEDGPTANQQSTNLLGSAVKTLPDEDEQNIVAATPKHKSPKKKAWYNAFYSNYKKRSAEFHKLFSDVPSSESLIVDYSCALQREILAHGRMYVSSNCVSFHSNIMGWEAARISLPYKSIVSLTKEKTAIVIPNAIEIRCKSGDKYFFATFASRDKAYLMLFRVWQNCLLDQLMTQSEIMTWVKQCYGSDLGPDSSDEEDGPDLIHDSTDLDDKTSFADVLDVAEESTSNTMGADKELFVDTAVDPPSPPSSARSGAKHHRKLKRFTRSVSNRVVTASKDRKTSKDSNTCNESCSVDGCVAEESREEGADEEAFGEIEDIRKGSEDASGYCNCESHLDHQILHESYDLNVDYLYECLFMDNSFSREFHNNRKIHVEEMGSWKTLPGTNTFARSLTLSIVSNLRILGPCVIKSVETQFMKRSDGSIIVDSEIHNSNIPYSDKFFVRTRHCISPLGPSRTSLRVTASVEYRKNVWALTRSLIQRNATQALREAFGELHDRLCEECSKDQPEKEGVEVTVERRKSRRSSFQTKHIEPISSFDLDSVRSMQYSLLRPVFLALVVSILLNLVLYMKLIKLEADGASKSTSLLSSINALRDKDSEHVTTLINTVQDVASVLNNLKRKIDQIIEGAKPCLP